MLCSKTSIILASAAVPLFRSATLVMTISTVSPSMAWLTSFRPTKRSSSSPSKLTKPKPFLWAWKIALSVMAGAFFWAKRREPSSSNFNSWRRSIREIVLTKSRKSLDPSFPRAVARSLIWALSCSCKYSLILVFIDLFAGYPASFFLSTCVFVLQNKNRQRHCLSLSYLLESTIKIIAINNQKKIIIAVKRCITASNPRALERSNKSFELASKTLLDWFFVGCIKIAIIINTDNTSKIVVNAPLIFKTP